MFKFELGQKAKDKITKKEGVITGRAEYLDNPSQYYICDGNPCENWTDEENIEVISE